MITTNVKSVVAWGGWKVVTAKRREGFWDGYNILFLDMDNGYMAVWFIIILYVLCSLLYTCYTLIRKKNPNEQM